MKDLIGIAAIVIVSGFIGFVIHAITIQWTAPRDTLRLAKLYRDADRWRKLDRLRNDSDGTAVELPNDNPNFGTGPDCCILVTTNWLIRDQPGRYNYETRDFRGDTIDECLDAALSALRPQPGPVPSATMT